MNRLEYNNIVAHHPGVFLKMFIEDYGMTQDELAKRMETSGKTVSLLINGKTDLTAEMAMKLSMIFGNSYAFWMNAQQGFTEKKLEIERLKSIDQQKKVADHMDYGYWVELGEIKGNDNLPEKIKFLQNYLKVSNLEVLASRDFLVPFVGEDGDDDAYEGEVTDIVNANAWTQTAFNFAREIEPEPYNGRTLKAVLPKLHELAENASEDTLEEIKRILLTCGIAMVFLPHLANNKVKSAVKWMGPDKVIFAMESKPDLDAEFWTTFFHGLFHVMQKRLAVLIADSEELRLNYPPKIQKLHQDAEDRTQDFMIRMGNSTIHFEALK